MNNTVSPQISVFMTARNTGRFIKEAISSILHQTFGDFEFLIVDDASTDNTWEIMQSFSDPRITLLRNPKQIRQQGSYNRMLPLARGKYFAIMDSDDISVPDRFERQVAFMDSHPDIWASSGYFNVMSGGRLFKITPLTEPDDIRAAFLLRNVLANPFAIMRGDKWREHSILYDPKADFAEDYEIWLRVLVNHPEAKFANLPEVLGHYRQHPDMVCVKHLDGQKLSVARAHMQAFKKLGLSSLDPDIRYHAFLYHKDPLSGPDELAKVFSWVAKLKTANRKISLFPPDIFEKLLLGALNELICSHPQHEDFLNQMDAPNFKKKTVAAEVGDYNA